MPTEPVSSQERDLKKIMVIEFGECPWLSLAWYSRKRGTQACISQFASKIGKEEWRGEKDNDF